MSKELKNITDNIMDQIHEDKIKMKPRIYFIVGSILTFVGFVSSVVVSVFLVGLMRFSLRAHGPMASYRLDQILSDFPLWAPVLAIIGLIVGIWLLRRYDFSFKVNFKLVIIGFILAVIVGGWIVDSVGINDVLVRRGPMRGMMRQYVPVSELGTTSITKPATERVVATQPTTEPVISILPAKILPGDPILITIHSTSTPIMITFDGQKMPIFEYSGKPRALIGIDLNEKAAAHTVKVTFSDGSTTTQKIMLGSREKIERPLGIPDKLGGNTTKAESELLVNLAKENSILNNVPTAPAILWSKTFVKPLANIFVTDDYGYDRKTVNSTIVHKGTDFRAPVGTEVKAMNDGVVRVAREFVIYGNTIIVDHGLGLQTLYMHLSKIGVKVGDKVTAGQVIGLSGMTGYAEQPHLHISVKINKVSIDPVVFLGMWK